MVSLPVSEFVTTTSLAPTVPVGVVQVIEVEESTTKLVQEAPPTVTVAPTANPVPIMVTEVPPEAVPDAGEIEVKVGVEIVFETVKLLATCVAAE